MSLKYVAFTLATIMVFSIPIGAVLLGIIAKIAKLDYNRIVKDNGICLLLGCFLCSVSCIRIYYYILYFSDKSLDDVKSVSISPTHATVEIDGFYPWGVNLKLENGEVYKTRVQYQEELRDLLDGGALIGKRANSNDFHLYTVENDTICVNIQHPHFIGNSDFAEWNGLKSR
ncbi:MAG: hypothetical protein HDS88_04175 [Bacteroidales bacterium]|nr:hypothetical protein [Bacteroidales bacterium]MBD5246416.1 hypothetical protein [Barnesiella sp.]